MTPRSDFTGPRIILADCLITAAGLIFAFKITCIILLAIALILAVLVLTH